MGGCQVGQELAHNLSSGEAGASLDDCISGGYGRAPHAILRALQLTIALLDTKQITQVAALRHLGHGESR